MEIKNIEEEKIAAERRRKIQETSEKIAADKEQMKKEKEQKEQKKIEKEQKKEELAKAIALATGIEKDILLLQQDEDKHAIPFFDKHLQGKLLITSLKELQLAKALMAIFKKWKKKKSFKKMKDSKKKKVAFLENLVKVSEGEK